MKLSIIAGLICTALVALAVACGGGDDKATNTPAATATTAANGSGATATKTPKGTVTKTPKTTSTKTTAGGGGDLNEYFRDLAARFELSRNDSDDAIATYNADLAAATTLDEQKQAINDFLDAMIQVFDDSILTMNGFSVPAIAEDPHFTFRDDIVQARAISKTLKTDLDAAETAKEVEAVVNDFDGRVGKLVDHAQAACRDLQATADAQSIDADLQCKAA